MFFTGSGLSPLQTAVGLGNLGPEAYLFYNPVTLVISLKKVMIINKASSKLFVFFRNLFVHQVTHHETLSKVTDKPISPKILCTFAGFHYD